ncbi:MAG: PilN domain-containing protein [Methylocystis sp.]|nr:PilN domain-containing protein [Methylocystis sp.]
MSSLGAFWTRELAGGSLKPALAKFAAWYREEFLSLFSRETAAWLVDRGDRELILRPGEGEMWLVDGRGARAAPIPLDDVAASSLDEALSRRGLTRKTTKLGLEIPPAAFFVRRFDIPAAAAATLAKLVVADIERKTPFRLADVAYGYASARHPANPDKLRVELWVLRRDLVAQAAEASGLPVGEIDFVRAAVAAGDTPAPTIYLRGAEEGGAWFRNAIVGLLALAAVIGAIGVGVTLARQKTANEELDARIANAAARAARVRKTADEAAAASRLLAALRAERVNGPLFADLWEEVSRILPDSAFVTDLRLVEPRPGERAVELVGFAASAVGLPALFDKSAMFTDSALTAPITPDEMQKKEGFSLRAQVAHKKEPAAK